MAGVIRRGRVTEHQTSWRVCWFLSGSPINRSRLATRASEAASPTARCMTWRAGSTRKAPRCRCGGCAGNLQPISAPIFGNVRPKTWVIPRGGRGRPGTALGWVLSISYQPHDFRSPGRHRSIVAPRASRRPMAVVTEIGSLPPTDASAEFAPAPPMRQYRTAGRCLRAACGAAAEGEPSVPLQPHRPNGRTTRWKGTARPVLILRRTRRPGRKTAKQWLSTHGLKARRSA